jgi:hypothetical protein
MTLYNTEDRFMKFVYLCSKILYSKNCGAKILKIIYILEAKHCLGLYPSMNILSHSAKFS